MLIHTITVALGIAFLAPSTLVAQSSPGNATGQLTISATVVTSVELVMPVQGAPEIVVANGADPSSTFVRATLSRRTPDKVSAGVRRGARPPATDRDGLGSIAFTFPMGADQSESRETTRRFIDRSGQSSILKTTTLVAK